MLARLIQNPWPRISQTTLQVIPGNQDTPQVISAIVVQETHKVSGPISKKDQTVELLDSTPSIQTEDTDKHLHFYVQFGAPYCSRNLHLLFNSHLSRPGKPVFVRLQSVYNVKDLMKYLTKEDTKPASFNFDITSVLKKQNPQTGAKMHSLATTIMEGSSVTELAKSDEYRGIVLLKSGQIEKYATLVATQEPCPFRLQEIKLLPDAPPIQQLIVDYIKAVILNDKACMSTFRHGNASLGRTRHLWIAASSGFGKSTLSEVINSVFGDQVYYIPKGDRTWFDGIDEKKHKLWIADEYSGDFPINFINKICDQGEVTWPRRGKAPARTRGMKGIILSNGEPRTVYHGNSMNKEGNAVYYETVITALENRFEIVNCLSDDSVPQLKIDVLRKLNPEYVQFHNKSGKTLEELAVEAGDRYAIPEQILNAGDDYAYHKFLIETRESKSLTSSSQTTDSTSISTPLL